MIDNAENVESPKKIYLQWHKDSHEVTWCEDMINDDDIEYVRKEN